MRLLLRAIVAVTIIAVFAIPSPADVPANLTYQGRLLDAAGDPVSDGKYLIQFRIYDVERDGDRLWDSNLRQLIVANGLFSYNLGDTVAMRHDLFLKRSNLWLGIRVGTGSELLPRIKLTSSGFAYQALRSDSSQHAATLAGKPAVYYLDWINLKNLPAGFADGIDDTSNSMDWSALTNVPSGFSDGVDNVGTGDITGVTAGSGLTGGGVHGPVTLNVATGSGIKLAADSIYISKNSLTQLHLGVNSVAASEIAANAVGASEVADNSLTADKMFNEPGIAGDLRSSNVIILSQTATTMVDLATTTITIPSSGYVFIWGHTLQITGVTTGENIGIYQIDENTGGGISVPHSTWIGHIVAPNLNTSYQGVETNRVYFKNAGTYTFRLEAMARSSNASDADTRCFYSKIIAMYFPTSYGSVNAISEQPGNHPDAKQVTIIGLDGSTHTAYEMDLRYYELKAKEARLKAAEAELELAKVRATTDEK